MRILDLHVHSTASDGTSTPTEVVQLAKNAGLTGIALTDHDTVSGVQEAITAGVNIGIEVIPGIEFSTNYLNRDVHILGLSVDYQNQSFLDEVAELADSRDVRNQKMLEKLNQLGYSITYEDLTIYAADTIITRAHFARALIEKGYFTTTQDVFKELLGSQCPGYVPRSKATPEIVISLIKKAGGYAVLAHPMLYNFTLDELDNLIAYLKPLGLDGIEAIYSSNTNEDDKISRFFARKHNLFITAGSDYHGSTKPNITIGMVSLKVAPPQQNTSFPIQPYFK